MGFEKSVPVAKTWTTEDYHLRLFEDYCRLCRVTGLKPLGKRTFLNRLTNLIKARPYDSNQEVPFPFVFITSKSSKVEVFYGPVPRLGRMMLTGRRQVGKHRIEVSASLAPNRPI